MTYPQENAIGIPIEYTVLNADGTPKDISTAVGDKILVFKKPNGERVEKIAAFKTTGSDGILTYTTQDGDLIPYGSWQVQAKIELPTGFDSPTEVALFHVYKNL